MTKIQKKYSSQHVFFWGLPKFKKKTAFFWFFWISGMAVDEIIRLYGERKISNIATAENLIKGFTSSNKKVYDEAFQKYKDSIKELKKKQPLNQRMAETKKRKKKNTYLISFYLYKRGHLKKESRNLHLELMVLHTTL